MGDTRLRRIQFELQQDEDGYPPMASETLWAMDLGNETYELVNIPFFARGVSSGDVVSAPEVDGLPTFSHVIRRGGHATLRVVLFDEAVASEARQALVELGAASEGSHLRTLFSVDVPPMASLAAIRAFLAEGAAAGKWDWEESDVPW